MADELEKRGWKKDERGNHYSDASMMPPPLEKQIVPEAYDVAGKIAGNPAVATAIGGPVLGPAAAGMVSTSGPDGERDMRTIDAGVNAAAPYAKRAAQAALPFNGDPQKLNAAANLAGTTVGGPGMWLANAAKGYLGLGGEGAPGQPPRAPAQPINGMTPNAPNDRGMSQDPLAAMQRGYNVPAHSVDLHDPRLRAQLREAYGDEARDVGDEVQAAGMQAEANDDKAWAEVAGHKELADTREHGAGDVRNQADARQMEFSQRRAMIDDQSARVAEMSKEDPSRWWNSRGTDEKIGWTIATALDSFGGALTHHGGNDVVGMINKHVDDDIAAQRQDYMHGRARADDMNNLYGMALKAAGNHDAAYELAREWGLNAVQDHVDSYIAANGSKQALANGARLKAQIAQNAAKARQRGIEADMKSEKWVQAQTISPNAAAARDIGKNSAEEHRSDRMQREQIPRLRAIEADKEALIRKNGGTVPGSSWAARAAYGLGGAVAGQHGENFVNSLPWMNDAAVYRGIEGEESEALNKMSGQRGHEMYEKTLGIVRGPGTDEYRKGVNRHFTESIGNTERNINNAYGAESAREAQMSDPMQPSHFSGHGDKAESKKKGAKDYEGAKRDEEDDDD